MLCRFHDPKSPFGVIRLLLGTLPTVQDDPVLVRILFKNVLTNVFKFTRGRKNALIIASAYEENSYDVVSVRDNGAGFDIRYADRLFGIFQRLHSAEVFEGTGVGLAMIDRIMKRHGGQSFSQGRGTPSRAHGGARPRAGLPL